MDFSVVVLDWSRGYHKPNVLYLIQDQISSKKEAHNCSNHDDNLSARIGSHWMHEQVISCDYITGLSPGLLSLTWDWLKFRLFQ